MTDEQILKLAIEKYRVTEGGRVFNRKRGNELKLSTYRGGYKYICVCVKKGLIKKVKVHRMVAYEFIPNPENKPHINHLNCNTSDNRKENLEWCTQKENVIHGFKMGREIWNKDKISKSQIYRICKKYPRKMLWILTTNNFAAAKAFWGEDEVKVFEREINDFGDWFPKRWEFHLTKLILEKEPLKYIEQYLTPQK